MESSKASKLKWNLRLANLEDSRELCADFAIGIG